MGWTDTAHQWRHTQNCRAGEMDLSVSVAVSGTTLVVAISELLVGAGVSAGVGATGELSVGDCTLNWWEW